MAMARVVEDKANFKIKTANPGGVGKISVSPFWSHHSRLATLNLTCLSATMDDKEEPLLHDDTDSSSGELAPLQPTVCL